MRVLVAPDCFSGTLTAPQAAAAIAAGWRDARPDAELDILPLSDGGPGFLDVLHAALGGRLVPVPVPVLGPLGDPVAAALLLHEGTAYVESAQACGLHLVPADRRDPERTCTRGVGDLLAAAAVAGARRVVVGLGGSGTNDGGAGALRAVGWTVEEDRLEPGPPYGPELLLATDVDNPLLGPHGATAVFGPQKGATPEQLPRLEARLARLAELAGRRLPAAGGLAEAAGAGAAGGLGFGLMLLGGRRVSGVGLVADAVGLASRAAAADVVVTGEGSLDAQSLRGKVVAGVAAVARGRGVPCVVLAGRVDVAATALAAAGVTAARSLVDLVGADDAVADAAASLRALAVGVAAEWRSG